MKSFPGLLIVGLCALIVAGLAYVQIKPINEIVTSLPQGYMQFGASIIKPGKTSPDLIAPYVAKIKSDLAGIRPQAESLNISDGNYDAVCGANNHPQDSVIKYLTNDIQKYVSPKDVVCGKPTTGDATAYAFSAATYESWPSNTMCVDSNRYFGYISSSISENTTVCPLDLFSIKITSPFSGATYDNSVSPTPTPSTTGFHIIKIPPMVIITVDAYDNAGKVTGFKLYVNDQKIGDYPAKQFPGALDPFLYIAGIWGPDKLGIAGNFTLRVESTDDKGKTVSSAPVTITLTN